jgi:hypothetical protein
MAKIEEITTTTATRDEGAAATSVAANDGGKTTTIAGKGKNDDSTTMTTTTNATNANANAAAKPEGPQLKPKMFISPILLMGGKRLGIDYKDPEHIQKIRLCFVCAMTVLALAFAALWTRLASKKKKLEEDQVEVKVKDLATGATKHEKVSLYEHDAREYKKLLQSNLMGAAMVSMLHMYFKVVPPLLLQSIMMPLNLVEGNLFQVHMLGRDERTNAALKRPWEVVEQKSAFAALAEAMSPETKKPQPKVTTAKKDPKKNPKHKR